jgi:predicted nuclease with RNAse H fold
MSLLTLGIDLSSMPKNTVACEIEWKRDSVWVKSPITRCCDETLYSHIACADVVGIDAPFGWPVPFTKAVHNWTSKAWTPDLRRRLQFRETDRHVNQQVKKWWPLSVSSDRIALPAMRAMALLKHHGVTDKSGDSKFFEVYPAATLHCWGFYSRGYKTLKDESCRTLRAKIVRQLKRKLPSLEIPKEYVESADALDALIASLTARAAWLGKTRRPSSDQVEAAKCEGWIHLPEEWPECVSGR